MVQAWHIYSVVGTLLWTLVIGSSLPVYRPEATRILDKSGGILYELPLHQPGRSDVVYEDLPPYVTELLLLQEDKQFYNHTGVDVLRLGAAAMDMVTGSPSGGASTISSQTIKQLFFPDSSRDLVQKAREFAYAWSMEWFLSKDQILETYLEVAPFGRTFYGIEAASQGYFSKSATQLSIAEAATLIRLLPAPSSRDPIKYPERIRDLRDGLLEEALDYGILTESEAVEAMAKPVYVNPARNMPSHVVMEALRRAETQFPDVRKGGYEIQTTIDPNMQEKATEIIAKHVRTLDHYKVSNGATVMLNPETGATLAYIGGSDFESPRDGEVDMVQAKRQPGSSLKPFTYLAGLEQGMTPATLFYDIESSFPTSLGQEYAPKNYDLKFHGPVRLRDALGSSLNIPAVQALDQVGFDTWYALLESFGLTFPEDPEYYGLGITLGGGEVTLEDLTHAYSMLANGGSYTNSYLIESIKKDGRTMYSQSKNQTQQRSTRLSEPLPGVARENLYLLTHILQDPVARTISFGLQSRLNIHEMVAVKTGTTKDFRDNWAFGYTPKLTVGVWVGNADNTPMEGVTGITGAVPMLHDLFHMDDDWFVETMRPDGIVEVSICGTSGMLHTEICPEPKTELFREGTEPTKEDTWFQSIALTEDLRYRWRESCNGGKVGQIFLVPPTQILSWARSIHIKLPPTEYCDGEHVQSAEDPYLASPRSAAYSLQTDLPLAAQKIPLTLEGYGYWTGLITIDGDVLVDGEILLPYQKLLELGAGQHSIRINDRQIDFSLTP